MSHQSALSVVLSESTEETHDLITGALAPTTFRRAVNAWSGGGSAGQLRSSSLLLMRLDWAGVADDGAPSRRERAELLRTASVYISACLRDSDVFGRADADTLGLLLPSTSTYSAEQVARRLRAAISARLSFRGQPVTMSVGLTPAISDQPWRDATTALRDAQNQGGDQTVLGETLRAESFADAA